MSETAANPRIAAIRQDLNRSYEALLSLVRERAGALHNQDLYRAHIENEWTVMENLAHIAEFMPYWAGEIEKLAAQPGQKFGRTMQDEKRLKAIAEHGQDKLEKALAELPPAYATLDRALAGLKDSDLQLTGVHSRYGEKPLDWFIEEFVTGHLRNHLEQLNTLLDNVR